MKKCKDMKYHEGIVMKIYPSDEQKHIIVVNSGAQRSVYNFLVAADREIYLLKEAGIYIREAADRIDYLKSVTASDSAIKNALPYLYEDDVDAQTVANAIKNYHTAWKNMKENHTGIPTFHKKSYGQSYQTNAHYYKNGKSNVRFEDGHHITLPKLGRIRFDGSPDIVRMLTGRENTRIGTITISRDNVGEYWVSLQLASDDAFADKLSETGSQIGIDLNLIELVNVSDGNAYANKRFYRKSEKKLAKAQKKLSRRAERAKKENRSLRESRNYQKQRRKVAYLHRKTARQREDYLHNVSRDLVKNHDLIAAEDLKVGNLLRNHNLAKAIADAGWRTFLTMLQYKAAKYGKTVILVPPQYTTQTCSECGHVMKGDEKLPLSVREWDCPKCGAHHVRDTNAAKNILAKALASL